jgi:tol-pal system protein YbgF
MGMAMDVRTMTRMGLGAALLAAALTFAVPAAAQDARELVNRLDRLERDLQIMQRQLSRGGVPSSSGSPAPASTDAASSEALLQYEQRLSAYEEQLRRMTGQLEETTFNLGQLARKLEKQVSDVEFRVKALEDARGGTPGPASAAPGAGAGLGTPPSGTAPAPTQGAPGQPSTVVIPAPAPQQGAPAQQASAPAARSVLPAGSPEDQFKYAFDFLKQNDTQQGERALRAFTEAHPKHALSGNAHFWLGQIYFSGKDFSRAAVAFATSYEKFPDGAKAPDSLVRLAGSLAQLNKKDEACAAYKQLNVQYPTAPPALKQGAQTEAVRLGCR